MAGSLLGLPVHLVGTLSARFWTHARGEWSRAQDSHPRTRLHRQCPDRRWSATVRLLSIGGERSGVEPPEGARYRTITRAQALPARRRAAFLAHRVDAGTSAEAGRGSLIWPWV